MATASGTSILGQQTLLNNVVVTSKLMSFSFPGRVQPPVKRYGYFYMYQFDSSNIAIPHYIVEEGLIRSPGLLMPLRLGQFSSTFFHRLDVVWSLPGIAWTATVV